MDQQWVKFKTSVTESAVEEIPRVEKKTQQRWMAEDILDLLGTMSLKNNREIYETFPIRKKYDTAKEKCRNLKYTEVRSRQCTKAF